MAIYHSGRCWKCGVELEPASFSRESHCPNCGKPAHVCRNCRFFAPGRPNECQEPLVERVVDKERANFCDYFEPSAEAGAGRGSQSSEELRKAAESLFK